MTKILLIGLHPSEFDYTKHPELDEVTLLARIEQGDAAVREAGFDVESCLVGAGPDEAEKTVRERLSKGHFDLAMIGGGLRMPPEHTLPFERLANALAGVRLFFNTSPDTTVDALRRGT
ncbi:hypothetical protein ABZ897_24280 [Nonomuraea sp. NPDC046802]|uniref:hypothetical protein n=1 Tax=Nonomuraea sp. NPDC046802 TaxID=3154919 RepID=UPI0033FAF02C